MTTTISQSIDKLNELEKMLLSKRENMDRQIIAEMDIARSNALSRKKVAVPALYKKTLFQMHQKYILDALETIKELKTSLEQVPSTAEVIRLMNIAGKTVNNINQKMDSEIIILQEKFEGRSNAPSQVGGTFTPIATPPSTILNIDEMEIMKELDELETEAHNKAHETAKPVIAPIEEKR